MQSLSCHSSECYRTKHEQLFLRTFTNHLYKATTQWEVLMKKPAPPALLPWGRGHRHLLDAACSGTGTLNISSGKRDKTSPSEEHQYKDLTKAARPTVPQGYAQVAGCTCYSTNSEQGNAKGKYLFGSTKPPAVLPLRDTRVVTGFKLLEFVNK